MIHYFAESQQIERQGRGLLDDAYRTVFPDLEQIVPISSVSHQKSGADTLLLLGGRAGPREVWVDEKVRSPKVSDRDVLLELEHEYSAGRKDGWLMKQLRAQFLAYAWLGTGRVWLLPVEAIRTAWATTWANDPGLRRVRAQNQQYVTISVVIPEAEVARRCGVAHRLDAPMPGKHWFEIDDLSLPWPSP